MLQTIPCENAGHDNKSSSSNGGFFQLSALLARYTRRSGMGGLESVSLITLTMYSMGQTTGSITLSWTLTNGATVLESSFIVLLFFRTTRTLHPFGSSTPLAYYPRHRRLLAVSKRD